MVILPYCVTCTIVTNHVTEPGGCSCGEADDGGNGGDDSDCNDISPGSCEVGGGD